MLNKWRDLIQTHNNMGRHCEHSIREANKTSLIEKKMRLGFRRAQSKVLVERPQPG